MAQPTTFAKKNSVPMEPPNSRPSVRLIITKNISKNMLISKTMYTHCHNLQYTPPPSTAPFVEIAHTDATVNNKITYAITNCNSVTYKPALPTIKPENNNKNKIHYIHYINLSIFHSVLNNGGDE